MPIEWPSALAAIVGAAKLVGSAGDAVVTRMWPRFAARRAAQNVAFVQGVQEFTPDHFLAATRYYIEPSCGPLDPAGAEEYRLAFNVPVPLFSALDEALYERAGRRYLLLLADSGMGKTSALLNYYVRNLRRRHRAPIALFYLGRDGVDERIVSLPNKPATILFLDALDEDPQAISDHHTRVNTLMRCAAEFRSVIISCRSQFFLKDEEITRDTGIANIGPRAAGEGANHAFYKLYLSPLSDSQVEAYLRRRYPRGKRGRRLTAQGLVNRIGDLSARPMILAYVDDLTNEANALLSTWDAYTRIVAAWLEREQAFVGDTNALRSFSRRLAVDIFVRSADRGGERIDFHELMELAKLWDIQLDARKLTGRSLLNRDAAGQFKFAHRSIMEYLFVEAALQGDLDVFNRDWTDQMAAFLVEAEPSGAAIRSLVPPIVRAQGVGHLRTSTLLRALTIRAIKDLVSVRLTHLDLATEAADHCAAVLQLVHLAITSQAADVLLIASLKHPMAEAYTLRTECALAGGELTARTESIPMKSEAARQIRSILDPSLRNPTHTAFRLLSMPGSGSLVGYQFGPPSDTVSAAHLAQVHELLQAAARRAAASSTGPP